MAKTSRKTKSHLSVWAEHPLLVGIVAAIVGAIAATIGTYILFINTRDPPVAERASANEIQPLPGPPAIRSASSEPSHLVVVPARGAGEDLNDRRAEPENRRTDAESRQPKSGREPEPVASQASAVAPGRPFVPENAIPSCYAAVRLSADAPTRSVFIFIDQTTQLDETLMNSVRSNLQRLLRPGTRVAVASFSATENGRYPRIIVSGTLEPTNRNRPSVAISVLGRLDQCLALQRRYGTRLLISGINRAMAERYSPTSRSEILDSLKQLSGRVTASPAADRIVLIVSDMIERSSAGRFDQVFGARLIPPAMALRRSLRASPGNFGGARIFVLGAAFVPDQETAPRNPREPDTLESFWAEWFRLSNGRLVAFGRPNLLNPVG